MGNKLAAVEAYRKAIALAPTFLRSYVNLGCLLQNAGKLDDAEQLLRKALSLQPDFHVTLCNLANVVKDAGKIEEANDLFRQALEQNPSDVLTHSNLAYSVHFDPRCTPQDILTENLRFDAMHAEPSLASERFSTAKLATRDVDCVSVISERTFGRIANHFSRFRFSSITIGLRLRSSVTPMKINRMHHRSAAGGGRTIGGMSAS